MAEYSGVKPDEYVTLDRRSSEASRHYISTDTTLFSTNSCSTLNRSGYHRDLWNFYGQSNLGFQDDKKYTSSVAGRSRSMPQQRSLPTVAPLGYDSGKCMKTHFYTLYRHTLTTQKLQTLTIVYHLLVSFSLQISVWGYIKCSDVLKGISTFKCLANISLFRYPKIYSCTVQST